MRLEYPVVGADEKSRVLLVHGTAPVAVKGDWKIIRLRKVPEILIDRANVWRPLRAGVSVGHVDITAGTLGYYATYQNEVMLLSNAHVFHPEPWVRDMPLNRIILQPGPLDVKERGWDVADPKLVAGEFEKHMQVKLETAECAAARAWLAWQNFLLSLIGSRTRFAPISVEKNRVDAALARPTAQFKNAVMLDDGREYVPKKIFGLLFAGSDADGLYIYCKARNVERELGCTIMGEVGEAGLGDAVRKCGRTTGCTAGPVVATNLTVRVWYGAGFAVFEDCGAVMSRVAGGDSGSLVFE